MKKNLFILVLLALVSMGKLSAQQLNYQGIARNANGVAMSFQAISLRLTIKEGTSTGISVYSETRQVRTNQFGLFTVVIGSPGATNVFGSFATINWISSNKYLQVEIDPAGGTAFQLAGVSQLQAVPYAYFAAAAYPVGLAGGDLRGSTYPDPIIAPKVVTNGKLADTSVSTSKIIDRNVTNIKIANPYIYFNDLPVQLGQGQYFITDSLGANFNILSYDSIHKFNIPSASATKRGLLKSSDWTYFNNKLNLSDTAAMLLGYTRELRFLDTATALQSRIQTKQPLGNYLTFADSLTGGYTSWLLTKKKIDSLGALKLNISDTAAMLLGYTRELRFLDTATALQTRIQTKQPLGNYLTFADSLTGGYTTWLLTKKKIDSIGALKINLSDTAAMLLGYTRELRFLDTATALQTRIQTKQPLGNYLTFADSLTGGYTSWLLTKKKIDSLGALKINLSDTAAMLLGYTRELRFLDTATALQTRIQTKQPLGNYLTFADSLTGGYTSWLLTKKKIDSLGALKLNISDTVSMLNKKWSITGNSGLDSTINFLGTTENQPLQFRVGAASTWAGELNPLSSNTSFGLGAGQLLSGNTNNTAMGVGALSATTTGSDNTAIGQAALQSNQTGENNTAVGQNALNASIGTSNTAVGQAALRLNTANENTAVGRAALQNNVGGTGNTSVGWNSLSTNLSGGNNVAIGFQALNNNTTTSGNTAVGYQADITINTLENATAIGNTAKVATSNTVQLGNTSVALVNTSGRVAAAKFIGNTSAITVSSYSAPITGSAIIPNIIGNDVAGYITFTATGAVGNGTAITINFGSAYPVEPVVLINAINTSDGSLSTNLFVIPANTGKNSFTIVVGAGSLTAGDYQIAYHVLGR